MIYIFHFFGCKNSDELVNSTECFTKLNFFSVHLLINHFSEMSLLKSQLIAFNHIPQGQLRVIDVACGSGQTLKLMRETLSKVMS
ncbi:MAG: hypothetical protein AN482_19880 [Anabaena sp. LE011-02]|jgi:ubiquinone/menaquinone biosynthesis C-methylase UbiE|nr:MAG: hypothetical protein AN482_19880 [Anabaena sp. LE011-02]